MGQRLAARGSTPDILISSPALRAYSTAMIIAAQIGYPKEVIQKASKLYFEGAEGLLDVIRSLPAGVNAAMLFGHNPTMTESVNALARATIDNMPTCGIAEIRFDVTSWEDVDNGLGVLQWYDYPKRIDD